MNYTIELSDDEIAALKKKARRETLYEGEDDDNNIYDYCGGNYDDAYQFGLDDGEAFGARDILAKIGVDWEE